MFHVTRVEHCREIHHQEHAMIDPMSEPHIVAVHEKLENLAIPIAKAFRAARYGVEHPQFELRYKAEDCKMTVKIYSHTGSGDMQYACIQFNGKDECSIFVGPLYDAPRPENRAIFAQAGLIPPADSRLTIPSSTPDLATVLLKKVRRFMLDQE
jgi:hypothetical protein